MTDLFLFGKKQGSIFGIIVLQPALAASKHLHAAALSCRRRRGDVSKPMKNRTLYSIIILCQREHALSPEPALKMCAIDRPTLWPRHANITLPLDGKNILDDSFNSIVTTQANNLK